MVKVWASYRGCLLYALDCIKRNRWHLYFLPDEPQNTDGEHGSACGGAGQKSNAWEIPLH